MLLRNRRGETRLAKETKGMKGKRQDVAAASMVCKKGVMGINGNVLMEGAAAGLSVTCGKGTGE